MAARPDQAVDLRVFDAYFVRADVDRDGYISGQEAVAFFQGSNLPRHVLAQIWMYADQKRAGFLVREEFYNALRLITVAQSGVELTPDKVQAILRSPNAAKIPPPKINGLSDPASQMKFAANPSPSSQMSAMGPFNQPPGLRGQTALPNTGMNQLAFPTGNHLMRPPQVTPSSVSHLPPQSPVVSRPPVSISSGSSTDLFSRNNSALPHGPPQSSLAGPHPSVNQDSFGSAPGAGSKPPSAMPLISSNPRDSTIPSLQSDSKSLVLAGNGFPSDSNRGNVFSGAQAIQEKTMATFSSSTTPNSSRAREVDPWQNMALVPSNDNQLQKNQSLAKQNQLDMKQGTSAMTSSIVPAGIVGSTSTQSQPSWPKFSQSDIQRYLAIFIKVDNDRDGKITGEEARNLFLSWRLPREVLKQVWDLSDQDNDGMLSLREFCIALYLMERHREKCPLPTVLPDSVKSDQTLLMATNHPSTAYGGPASQPRTGMTMPRPTIPAGPVRPQMQKPTPVSDDIVKPVQQKSRVPILEKCLVDQLSKDEQSALNSKFQEASDADKKVQDLEKEILDSKEKTEFYRTKMQELILYKSRCDNRSNEVTERASTDKQEVESLTKRYEQKCKQVGDVASKLTIEEATFRDIQEKKLEIYNRILKLEQDDAADGSLQDRADNVQKDLEELVKVLNERCKQYRLRSKPMTLFELPFGWQLGIQEGAADWDEDWDKFEEDGFSVIKELTIEVEKVVPTETPKPQEVKNDKPSTAEVSQSASSNGENKTEEPSTTMEQIPQSPPANGESQTEKPSTPVKAMSENGSTNLDNSPTVTKSPKSPGASALENHEDLNPGSVWHDGSPHANENSSDHDASESFNLEDKHTGEPSWSLTFDRSDDTDSVWSYNPKENDHQKRRQNFSFGSDDFGLFPPINTGSPSAASVAGKDKGPFFDSVPSTPMYNTGFSPRFNDGTDDHSFDSFSQHDFFGGTHDSGAFGQRDSFGRFDSFRSNTDFGKGETFTGFDSMRSNTDYGKGESFTRFDSMRSNTDYGKGESFARFDSMRSTTDYGKGESFARFDSIRSTTDYSGGLSSFDGTDLFGSGPFKSSESHSPRKGTTNWDAF